MKAKETASEPSRKGRLSLEWSGKGCCEETRKKFTFESGGGERGRTKTGIEEERSNSNSNLQVKRAPAHPASLMRGGSASK